MGLNFPLIFVLSDFHAKMVHCATMIMALLPITPASAWLDSLVHIARLMSTTASCVPVPMAPPASMALIASPVSARLALKDVSAPSTLMIVPANHAGMGLSVMIVSTILIACVPRALLGKHVSSKLQRQPGSLNLSLMTRTTTGLWEAQPAVTLG